MKTFLLFLAGFCLPIAASAARLQTLVATEEATLRSHPALAAAHARWLAARERVPQAQAWADPMAGFEFEKKKEGRSPFSEAKWMVSQTLPLSGRPEAAGRVAEAEAATAHQELKQVRSDLLMRVRAAYVAYASASENLRLNAENQRILADIINITQRKLETGESMLADSLQAQAESAMLEDKRADLSRQHTQARVTLNSLMQRPVDAPLSDPAPLTFQALSLTAPQMMGQALRNNPSLLTAQSQVLTDTQKIDLAQRQRRPDPNIEIFVRQLNGDGLGIQEGGIGFTIPLTSFNRKKYDAGIREAEAMRQASEAQVAALRFDTLEAIRLKYEAASTAARRYLILRDQVVPAAQKALESRAADFTARKASFLEYNTIRILLQNAQIEQFERLTTYQSTLAELRTLTQDHSVP